MLWQVVRVCEAGKLYVSREDEVDGTLDGIERAKVTDFAIITKGPPK